MLTITSYNNNTIQIYKLNKLKDHDNEVDE